MSDGIGQRAALRAPRAARAVAAFTVIEMLVVVSLITLLLAMLSPSLQKSRRSARAAICLSNQRQLHIAQQNYCDNNDGRTPVLSHAVGQYWHTTLATYLGDPTYRLNPNLGQWKRSPLNVLTCPEAKRDPVGGFGSADIVWNWGGGGQGGYGANLWVYPNYLEYNNDWRFPRGNFYPTFAAVDRPSDVPLFGDSNWVGSWPDTDDTVPTSLYWGSPAIHEVGYFMGRFGIDRHDRAIQIVFTDSSARRVTIADLWQQHWHRTFQTRVVTVP